jgi:CelD/BcsL family acetyltransferase involved in cellulose biosynthesis
MSALKATRIPVVEAGDIFQADILHATALAPGDISAWRAIAAADADLASPFYDPAFIQAVAASRPDVYVAVISAGGRRCAFLPYQYASPWHRRFGAAERVGGELSDYFGLIAAPDVHIRPQDLLRLCGLHTLAFTHLDESQRRFGLPGELPEPGLRIRLTGGAAAYWSELSRIDKRLVSDTDRRERKLIETYGPLRFELAAADTAGELDRLIAAKRAQYARTGVRDALAEPWTAGLLTALSDRRDTSFRGQLSVLFAGDTWVASHFGLRSRHVLHYWFPVYAADLKAFSPGRLLLKAVIGAADAAGITVIDRGSGDQAAKREFANETHQYLRDSWHVPGPQSFSYRAARALMWRLNRR